MPAEYVLLLTATAALSVPSVQPAVLFLALFPYDFSHLWRLFAIGIVPWMQTVLLLLHAMLSIAVFVSVLLGAIRLRSGRVLLALMLLVEAGTSAMQAQFPQWLALAYALLALYYVPRLLRVQRT
jgi:hypothetical protein